MSILLALDYIPSDSNKSSACIKYIKESRSLKCDELIEMFKKFSQDAYKIEVLKVAAPFTVGFADKWIPLMLFILQDSYKRDFVQVAAKNGGIPYGKSTDFNNQIYAIIMCLNDISQDSYKVEVIKIWLKSHPELFVTCQQLKSVLNCVAQDTYKVSTLEVFRNNILDASTDYKCIIDNIAQDSYKTAAYKQLGVERPEKKHKSNVSTFWGGNTFYDNSFQTNTFNGSCQVVSSNNICFGNSVIQTGRKNQETVVQIHADHVTLGSDKYFGSLVWNNVNFSFINQNGLKICRVIDINGVYNLPVGSYRIKDGVILALDGSKMKTQMELEMEKQKVIILDNEEQNGEITEEDVKKRKEELSKMNKRELDSLEDALSCEVCCEDQRSTLLLPCRHSKLCISCAYDAKQKKVCPFCKQEIKSAIKIF